MTFTVEYEQDDDGRWLAEVIELPGVLAYGETSDGAIAKAQALALRVLADRLEQGESAPEFVTISFAAALIHRRQRRRGAFSALAGASNVSPALTSLLPSRLARCGFRLS